MPEFAAGPVRADAVDDELQALLPGGWLGAAVVLAVWAACTTTELALQSLTPARGNIDFEIAFSVAIFLSIVATVRVIRRLEIRRIVTRRRERRPHFERRLNAYSAEKNYYVLDVLNVKRGPYTLERLVEWNVEGKLGNNPLIYIRNASRPTPFDDVARDWRANWGNSMFDPVDLRSS